MRLTLSADSSFSTNFVDEVNVNEFSDLIAGVLYFEEKGNPTQGIMFVSLISSWEVVEYTTWKQRIQTIKTCLNL